MTPFLIVSGEGTPGSRQYLFSLPGSDLVETSDTPA
jgi:hypothetical protein